MILIKLFGFIMAAGVLFTSLAMMILGAKWQKIEAAAYSGQSRPKWFVVIATLLIILYSVALVGFVFSDKNWASWTLISLFPIGWSIKGLLVIFNKEGRKKVSTISGDKAWFTIGISRLPLVFVLVILALFA